MLVFAKWSSLLVVDRLWKKCILYFERGSKRGPYLEVIFNNRNIKTRQITKIHWFQQIAVCSILLCQTHYCVQKFTVSSKILCSDMLLIYTATSSTFPCWHAVVVSCFALHNHFSSMKKPMLSFSSLIWQ
jgi:hypothetical protein